MNSPLLDEFLRAVTQQDDSADEKLDRLIASSPADDLAKAVDLLLREGDAEAFAGAIELVNLLADRHSALWDSLIYAIENRPELGMENALTAVALLRAADRLPQNSACRELAGKIEEIEEIGHELDGQINHLLASGPDQLIPLLVSLEEMAADERHAAIADLLDRADPQTGRELLEILALPAQATGFVLPSGKAASAFCMASARSDLLQNAWVTDLSQAGQFGAGLDFMNTGEALHRFVLGGSWQRGVRLFEYQALAAEEPGFEIRLEPPRSVCKHPTLVKKWLIGLLESGFAAGFRSNHGLWAAGYLDRRLLAWIDEDAWKWDAWQGFLVEQNPLGLKGEWLAADASCVANAVSHWFSGDDQAKELVEEFRHRGGKIAAETGQSIVRVWFERHLGPAMAEIIARLRAMSFFWLAQSEMEPGRQEELEQLARASARLSIDLADPSRVVPGHPLVQAVAKIVFENK
ncbi:MAG: hypothetical protein ACKO85_04095 [Isosphaeraceae bacterium]